MKSHPRSPAIAGPTLRAPISAGGGACPSRATCAHLSLLTVLLEEPFCRQVVAVPVRPREGWRGRRDVQPCPSVPHRQSGHATLRHPEPRPGVSIPLSPPEKCPLAAHKSPSMRQEGAGAMQARDSQGGQVPEGKRARSPLRCHPSAWHNARCEGGEPRCHFTPWLSPPGAHGGPQVRTSALAGSGARGWGQRPRGLRRGRSPGAPYSCCAVFLASGGC